jgi:hypothetical protein
MLTPTLGLDHPEEDDGVTKEIVLDATLEGLTKIRMGALG